MNLFWLSRKLKKNARYHCDQHIVKIPLEAVQLLYTAWALLTSGDSWRASAPLNKAGTQRGYKISHPNHPLARWVRRSEANYRLCASYALALCKEYSKRFPGRTLHAEQHAAWLSKNLPTGLPNRSRTAIPIVRKGHTVWKAKSMKTACKAYRRAYIEDKLQMARYRHSSIPLWIQKNLEMLKIS